MLATAMELPFERLKEIEIESTLLDSVPPKAIFQYNTIPVREENQSLLFATADPFAQGLIDALQLATARRVRLLLSPLDDITEAARKFYGVGAETLDQMMENNQLDFDDEGDLLKQDLSDLDQEASVVKFVNQIIWEAYKDRATDIHIEPMETDLRIRYRIDGVLRETPMPPQLKRFQSSVISRIKVMANMDIAEKRLPQDGRISIRIRGEEIDVRVSTMPTVYGESVSLRLLMRGGGLITMSDLGLNQHDTKQLTKMITRPTVFFSSPVPPVQENPPHSTHGYTPSTRSINALCLPKIPSNMKWLASIKCKCDLKLDSPSPAPYEPFFAKIPMSSWSGKYEIVKPLKSPFELPLQATLYSAPFIPTTRLAPSPDY